MTLFSALFQPLKSVGKIIGKIEQTKCVLDEYVRMGESYCSICIYTLYAIYIYCIQKVIVI